MYAKEMQRRRVMEMGGRGCGADKRVAVEGVVVVEVGEGRGFVWVGARAGAMVLC